MSQGSNTSERTMNKPNTSFTLGVDDIDMIEDGLRKKLAIISRQRFSHTESTDNTEAEVKRVKDIDQEIKKINDLLGRLHQQKNWYRPKTGSIGG